MNFKQLYSQLTRVIGLSGVAFVLSPGHLNAQPVCATGSLQSYIDLDTSGGCTIGGITFFRFSDLTVTTVGNPTTANASTITITPLGTGGDAGFSVSAMQNGTNLFSIPNPTSPTESVTYSLNYSLDPLLGELGADPPFGDVTATQNYCVSDVFSDGCSRGTTASQTVTTANPFSVITLAAEPQFVDVDFSLALSASQGPVGVDAINILYGPADTSATPEPSSVLLLSAGGLLMVVPAWRKLKAVKSLL